MMNTKSKQGKRLEVRRNFITNKRFDFEESTMAHARYKVSKITMEILQCLWGKLLGKEKNRPMPRKYSLNFIDLIKILF